MPDQVLYGEWAGHSQILLLKSASGGGVKIPVEPRYGVVFRVEDLDREIAFAGAGRVPGNREAQHAARVGGRDGAILRLRMRNGNLQGKRTGNQRQQTAGK